MKTMYVTWQDPVSRQWRPVGRLTADVGKYRFVYTKGARSSPNFVPFGAMDDLGREYESDRLFPLFANRLLVESRPEYQDYLKWSNASGHDALDVLSTTGGPRETDTLEVFLCPEPVDGRYEVVFFSRGLRHLPKDAKNGVDALRPGDRLLLLRDVQNREDSHALALRTKDPPTLVGYCPRYFVSDFGELLDRCSPDQVNVSVERVNQDAPIQQRLLCRLSACWPEGFRPCSDALYEPLPDLVGEYARK